MSQYYEASDYAGIKTDGFEAYYGYVVTVTDGDGGEEWCFMAKFGGRSKMIPQSELPGKPDYFNCAECLIAGMAVILDQFDLVPNAKAGKWAKEPLDSPCSGA